MYFSSHQLLRPYSIRFCTGIYIHYALKGVLVCQNKVLPTNSIKASGSSFLLPVSFGTEQVNIDCQVRDRDRPKHSLSKPKELIPLPKGGVIMSAPPAFPLHMESLKNGTKVTNRLGLGNTVTGLDITDIVEPDLIQLCVDNRSGGATNPEGQITPHRGRRTQNHSTFVFINGLNLAMHLMQKGFNRGSRWSSNLTKDQRSINGVLMRPMCRSHLGQPLFKKSDLSQHSIKNLTSNRRRGTKLGDVAGISRANVQTVRPPTCKAGRKSRCPQNGIP
jgi:hypothetical protein